jgi:tetratricopeptide (TPR) repeat protein
MAEGLLGGLFGGEEELPEAEAAEAKVSAEAFAAAVAADQARRDPGVARATEVFLERQAALLKSQDDQLNDERALRLAHLRHQSQEGKLRRVGQRIRLGMQAFAAFVAGLIALGVLTMLYDAVTSRSVVVDAFKSPSALAGRGVTGDVVASGVLDALQKLQSATRAVSKALDAKGAWASDIKVELPETGVSIGEIDRLLHARFGHDLHIDGDLIQTDTGGLALTVRGDDIPAATFQGQAGELDKLTTEAAEYIYGRAQPDRYAIYLLQAGRAKDALAFLPGAYATATTAHQRAYLMVLWANANEDLGDLVQAIQQFRSAMALAPWGSREWWEARTNVVDAIYNAGGEEAAWRESKAFLSDADRAPKRERPPTNSLIYPATYTWDLSRALASLLENAAINGGAGTGEVIAGPFIADYYAQMHDPAQAARFIALSDPDNPRTKTETLLLQAYAALDRGAAGAAIAPLEAYSSLRKNDQDVPCFLGLAYGLSGRVADAEAAFKQTGPRSLCAAFHGDVLVHAGDAAGAGRVWAEGLKAAPDLPMVYLHRGLFELDRGDLAAARADLSTANAKAPHFADPLKAWGDLLAREGRWKDALAKYDEALKYAPAWAELHQARDAAAHRG